MKMRAFYRPLVFLSGLLTLPLLASTEKPDVASSPVSAPVSMVAETSEAPNLYFSPRDKVDTKLISLIENEKDDIKVAVYCLTHRGIIQALSDAQKRGVNVEIIIDPFTLKAGAPIKRMAQAGMSIYVWDPKLKGEVLPGGATEKPRKPLMHNKFCVFGKKSVWTGSFNFTSEGSKSNQENVVVLHDPKAAGIYLAEFERVKDDGCSSLQNFMANQPLKKKKAKLL